MTNHPAENSLQLPPRLSLAQLPTPLQALDRLNQQIGGPRIWVKRDDLTGSVLSGNKVRKLEFSLAQAQAEGCDTVITCGGLQSNHCRATALLCAQLGLKCHLLLRGEPSGHPDGNLLLDHLAGAEIHCYPARQYQYQLTDLLRQWQQHYQDLGRRAFVIPTGASDGIGVWGYFEACRELKADFERANISPQHIVCATGSGGTQAGLTAGAHWYGLNAQVWGVNVCDDEAWFLNKVAADLADWHARYQLPVDAASLAVKVIDGYVGPGYAIAEQEIYKCIAQVAALEGLVLDPVYTGKAFFGMLQELRAGRFGDAGDIVFVHTGGVFGVFPHKQHFEF
ncbi:D-cysteine desulfhydrase family protein [Spongiibacter taiwanensis]|uniref:1-aminocyclopropane-1-carboxylate deaminase/D-cysteine desulfhydrase n=1 Tax=Spongiibacter taiwanensis TaxID=1748242 RepID=UPI0020357308|nr:D-cysteine desulfhydrase family protein [Spongiibacter taiwanensis]USA43479.1 D-cysteine desulfhydrase family protein [Spongiibacter taiwanensis]